MTLRGSARTLAKALVPAQVRDPLLAWWRRPRPVDWSALRTTRPISRTFGFERGTPIDRYYIEAFLRRNQDQIRGRILEIGDPGYTRRFGGSRVTHSDVLNPVEGPGTTIVGDLASGIGIPKGAFDCIILTQTLSFIYETESVVAHVHAGLKPGGVVLATTGGISQISRFDMDRWGDFWRFTDRSLQRLFAARFGDRNVAVEAHGNELAASSMLYGMAAEDLRSEELDFQDHDYPVTLAVRAIRGREP